MLIKYVIKMTENSLRIKIKELESELQLKEKEVKEYLDKIDYLEDMIMDVERNLGEKINETNIPLLKLHLKDLERINRELKDKMGFLRLDNIKLKQELDKVKKGYFANNSFIQVVDNKFIPQKLESTMNTEMIVNEENIPKDEFFKYIEIICPKCETQKALKISTKIINQSQNDTTINIPKGTVCDHSFQIIADRRFNIRRYQVLNSKLSHLEYYKIINEKNIVDKHDELTQFTSLPVYQDIIKILRRSIDDREILGVAIFTFKGDVIYALFPPNILFNLIKEFEVRAERQLQEINKTFIELKNHQKIFSEYINFQNIEIILTLILSERVNFGMGTMLFKEIKKKIVNLIKDHKQGVI